MRANSIARGVVVVVGLILCLWSGSTRAQLIVNEVLADEPGGDVSLEFIELHNASPVAIDNLTFYRVDIESGAYTGSIALSGSIAAEAYLVVTRNSTRFEEHWGDSSGVWGDGDSEQYRLVEHTFQLSNDSGAVFLARLNDTLSALTWGASPGDGVSWERGLPDAAAVDGCIDPAGATPGGVNSLTPVGSDLAVADALAGVDNGLTVFTVVISNRGVTDVADPVVHFSHVDAAQPDSIGTLIGDVTIPTVDSGATWIFNTSYRLPGVYVPVMVWVDGDDRPVNDRYVVTAPGEDYPPVVINEFLANPQGALAAEWIELLNVSSDVVDLSGWRVGDALGLSAITDEPAPLLPNDFVVLTSDGFLFGAYYSSFAGLLIELESWQTLNNDQDLVRLLDPYGMEADRMTYGETFDNNVTWGRGIGEDAFDRWGRAEDAGGTPGEENRVRYSNEGESDLRVRIVPKIISPDGDGRDDSAMIEIVAPDAQGYTLKLYDSEGRLVRTFEEDATDLASRYVWDGRDGGGQRLPIGLYILLFEAEGVQSVKQAIVVAR